MGNHEDYESHGFATWNLDSHKELHRHSRRVKREPHQPPVRGAADTERFELSGGHLARHFISSEAP